MREFIAMLIYRLLLPLLFIAAFPGWVVKMLRRGGFGTRLGERIAIYHEAPDFEPCGAVHVHAVSVGESLLALKLIRAWLSRDPDRRFVLATGTATGHAVASAAKLPQVRVTYSPLDFPSMVRRYCNRFEPAMLVLIEGEAWPHLLDLCRKRNIPVSLVNARMSPRSERRYRSFAKWVRPVFAKLDAVAIQDSENRDIWRDLGVADARIHLTGSLKFDPGGSHPVRRPEFQEMLDRFGRGRKVVLAASTHPGEDEWIATAIRDAVPEALPVIVPRHAERRDEVSAELTRAGFHVVRRSALVRSADPLPADSVFLIDTTGELRDWTAHADAVIIGKSFLSTGGQNPCEAILASTPVICGPHMENFEPLVTRLTSANACLRADDAASLAMVIRKTLDPEIAASLTREASALLSVHEGATERILDLLEGVKSASKSRNVEFVISKITL